MKTIAVIVAGGSGTRFGAQMPKQFLNLHGMPILMHTINAFELALNEMEHEILVTLPADQFSQWKALCEKHSFLISHRVVQGGETRWHSVKNALDSIGDLKGVDVIAVHDGVRPLETVELIQRALDTARRCGSAIPVVPLNDSIRQVDGESSHALDRSTLRAVQTPQVFDARLLMAAYGQAFDKTFTDDASVVERMGHNIQLVEGDMQNLKITRPMDLALAEYIMKNA